MTHPPHSNRLLSLDLAVIAECLGLSWYFRIKIKSFIEHLQISQCLSVSDEMTNCCTIIIRRCLLWSPSQFSLTPDTLNMSSSSLWVTLSPRHWSPWPPPQGGACSPSPATCWVSWAPRTPPTSPPPPPRPWSGPCPPRPSITASDASSPSSPPVTVRRISAGWWRPQRLSLVATLLRLSQTTSQVFHPAGAGTISRLGTHSDSQDHNK